MEWEQDIASRRSGESKQVGIGEEVKQGTEGSLKRELYRWPTLMDFGLR
jgi:hypothetical protein